MLPPWPQKAGVSPITTCPPTWSSPSSSPSKVSSRRARETGEGAMSLQHPRVPPAGPGRAVTRSGSERTALSRRKFLGMSGAGALVASTRGWLLAPRSAQASPRNNPYDLATWEALAGSRLTLRTASEEQTVVAHHPARGYGRAYTVVLSH